VPKRLAQYFRYEKRFLEAGLQGVFIRRFYRNMGVRFDRLDQSSDLFCSSLPERRFDLMAISGKNNAFA